MQTQTSNTLHNAIMKAGSKDRPPMLAPDKQILISEGSHVTPTETYMETYKTVLQDIRDQLNAKAEAVQILLTGTTQQLMLVRMHDGKLHESYYSRFYKMMNELIRNQCYVTNHQVNVQFLLQLQLEWKRFVTLVKQSQELKTVSYHKLYDILKQHQNEVNEIKAKRIARTANPLALVAQQQPDNSPRINRSTGYENQRIGNVVEARETVGSIIVQKSRIQCYNCKEFGHVAKECQKPKRVKDAAYHREKMLLCKQEEAGLQLNVEQPDWRDDTDDESKDQELEAHYMYMAQLQEVSPDAADSRPIFDAEPLQKVSNNNHYNVFAIESKHPEQSESVHDTYPIEQDEHNVIIDSLDMSYNREQIDQDNDDVDLNNERELLASLIPKLKCEIDDNKNRNKFLETSNTVLVEKLKGEIEETISILSQQKEAQIKLYKTREDKKLDKVIALENKVKVLDNIVCKTGQSVQTMRMLNNKCRTSFAKPEFLKKAHRANPRLYDIGVILTTSVSRPQLKSNPMEDRVMLNNSKGKKQEVEDQRRNVKLSKNKTSVTACNNSLNVKTMNVNFVCATCGKCVSNEMHDMCVLKSVNDVNSRTKMPIAVPVSTREPKCTAKQSVAQPLKKTVASESNQKPRNITRKLYECVSVPLCQILHCLLILLQHVEIVLFIVDSGCSKHMMGNLKLLINFVEKFLGLNHNLFFVGQFCDADLEVAFRKSTCYIRDLKGNDLLTCSRGTDLYSIKLQDTNSPNPICLMAKATSSQAWLWHRRLSHLNFDTINLLSKNDIVTHLLRSKDETTEVLIDFLRLVQRGLHAQVRVVRTDKGTKFLNQTLHAYFAAEGILHQTSVARTPEQTALSDGENLDKIKEKGELKFFLGIQIHQSPRGIFINQAKYAQEILIKHAMTSCDNVGTPMATKHLDADLSAKPTEKHLTAVKQIFRYLKDTIHMGLWYPKDIGFELTAFSYLDHAGCLDSHKSTSGGVQFLGGDKLVSWSSKKQDCTSMSSAEVEYVSLSTCCAQVLWMRTQLIDYGFHLDKIPMYCDSKAAIAISCNPVQHSRTKHIDVRYHFIKEKVKKGIVELFFVGTEYQLADLFTKAFPEERFKYLVRRLGMRSFTPDELEALANESA
uniref:Retrovirus-related Pol polyprotein from transposon TNT 1-94 n=1 Tax=Tanacetum cinerariifolium TaxID=118510 RepID=A0A6L2MU02_TANCI|nr:retrovirus-related Pol polyprotein from transposon TNT 1-94 [Tanacetum cinerariifolium]